MEKYNLNKLIKVKANDFWPSVWYNYEKERKFLGRVTKKEGIYRSIYGDYIGMECPRNHTLINGVVMENPEVVLRYEGGIEKTYCFNTFEKAKEFAKGLTNDRKWTD